MLMNLISKRWFQVFMLMILLFGAVYLKRLDPKPLRQMQNITFDYYNKILPRVQGNQVVIIDLDEASLKKYGQWPWPHNIVAELIEKIDELGAKSIAFDMVFSEPDRTSLPRIAETLPNSAEYQGVKDTLKSLPDNDDIFAGTIKELGNIVTGFVCTGQETEGKPVSKTHIFSSGYKPSPDKFAVMYDYFATNLPRLSKAAAGNGSFCPTVEQDGIIRNVPLVITQRSKETVKKAKLYPSLSLEALRVALGKKFYYLTSHGEVNEEGLFGIEKVKVGDFIVPTDRLGMIRVYYSGHSPARYVPAWRVLDGVVDANRLKDKIVLIGASAVGLKDLRSTPLDLFIPGVEIHAEIIEQIFSNQYLKRTGEIIGGEQLVTAILGVLMILLTPFISTTILAFFVVAFVASGVTGSLYFYQTAGLLIDPIYPSLVVLAIFTVSAILVNLRSEAEKRVAKTTLQHYISPDLMDELMQDLSKLKLGGETRELSVMFTDIRNFTTISEEMDPAELIKMMNDFLTPMTQLVLDNKGTIDKYMGDAMMAFWNAPADVEDHAYQACLTAFRMSQALGPVNAAHKKYCAENDLTYHELKAGIGIASGPCSVGNMGSKQRFAYSALGDTVNLGSRLEGQTKEYGVQILAAEQTYKQSRKLAWLELDLVAVKGRQGGERIYTLLGDEKAKKRKAFKTLKTHQDLMLENYRTRKFKEARLSLADARTAAQDAKMDLNAYYDTFMTRIEKLQKKRLPKDWNGIWVATSK